MLHLFYISLIQWLALFSFFSLQTHHYYVCNLCWTIWCIQVSTPFQNKELNRVSIPLTLQLGKVATAMVLTAGSRHWLGISFNQFFYWTLKLSKLFSIILVHWCMHERGLVPWGEANNKFQILPIFPWTRQCQWMYQGDHTQVNRVTLGIWQTRKECQMQFFSTWLAITGNKLFE